MMKRASANAERVKTFVNRIASPNYSRCACGEAEAGSSGAHGGRSLVFLD
jgi:hypothetical protein